MPQILADEKSYNAEEVKAMAQAINFGRDIGEIKQDIAAIRSEMSSQKDTYVTRSEFAPIRLLVFGFAGLVLTSVIAALIALVLVPRIQ